MRRAFYWGTTLLQVVLLITVFGIQAFSIKRMGMMRYVVYMNRQLETQYPMPELRNTAIAIGTGLMIITALYVLIKKGRNKDVGQALPMLIVGVLETLAFILFAFLYSVDTYRSYYFSLLILVIITLVQDIKIIVCMRKT